MDKTPRTKDSRRPGRDRLIALSAAFLATLMAAPGHAINFPDVPLQSGTAYPGANIRFILDDSGSMNFIAMPKDIADKYDPNRWDYGIGESNFGLDQTVDERSYVHNTIYYNPATTYLPWIRFDADDASSRMTGGTSFTKVFRHPSLLADCGWDACTADLSKLAEADTETFFVPKGTETAADNANYYRYQLRKVGDSIRVVRSEWLKKSERTGEKDAGCSAHKNGAWNNCTFATPVFVSDGVSKSRTEEAELANYATWYSYHRSRMKVAKAGAAEAFAQLKDDLRVGYDSIWGRNEMRIPVGSDNGRFRKGNRKLWYDKLLAATGGGGTPLHTALQRAGNYYMEKGADGPWGPETKQISCRQNFAILTTDGYWNNREGYLEYDRDLKRNVARDAAGRLIGDADASEGPLHFKPKIKDDDTPESRKYEPKLPYKDNFLTSPNSQPDTLADVAMHYWKHDLQPDLANDVPAGSDTLYSDPAFWQHMVTFGVSIGLKGRLDPTDLDAVEKATARWGDPTDRADADRVDDLWHASVNSRGNFLVASNTSEFVRGLLDAFKTIHDRDGSASNVTSNSTSLVDGAFVYQAKYKAGKWTGELGAYGASAAGVALKPTWMASIPASGRTILTWGGSGGASFPTNAQKALLDASDRVLSPATADENVAYIKGSQAKERDKQNGVLRIRDSLLGDIVNSSPIYVQDTKTLFVGANDGMLHAFATEGDGKPISAGQELFAYVPGGINFSHLKSLSDPQYGHRYFVDGPIVVTRQNQTAGKNYLIGALGRGGKGVYALDVTTPRMFSNRDVMWELSSGANLGNVISDPIVARLNSGEDAVIFGNGLNSQSGQAVLYVVDIQSGMILHEINTGVGGDNGLSAPRGWDDDGNGTVDYVYAGDLKGNVWKFDLRTSGSAEVGLGGKPLFAAGDTQPITAGLALARDPQTGKRWVFAGTGRFLELGDIKDANTQAIYGLIDEDAPLKRSDLQSREILSVGDANRTRTFEPHAQLESGKKGWYLDLDEPVLGERVTSRPQVKGAVLLFASIIPPTEDTCDAKGRGYVNALDVFSGTSVPQNGYFNQGTVDGVPVGSVDLGVGMPTLPIVIDNLLVVGGSGGGIGQAPINPHGGAPRRVSWREILRD